MLVEELHGLPGHLIRRAHQISGALFSANLAPQDLTQVQYAAMVAIGGQSLIDATRLSELIALDKATLGGVIDRLEAKGFVRRRASKDDRRVKLITLTPAGRSVLESVESKVLKGESQLLAPLSAAERRRLIVLLRKVCGVTGGRGS